MKLRGWEASQDLKFVFVCSHQMINCCINDIKKLSPIASTSTSNNYFFVSMILVTYLIYCPHPNQRITCSIHISIKLFSPIVSKDITVTWNSTFVALPAEKKQMIRKFEKCFILNWEKKENVQRKYYFHVILCPGDFWEIRLCWCLNLQSSTAV